MQTSLYIKYGGYASIHQLIEIFYDKVLASEIVGSYFKNSDMETLIEHQTNFICALLGGPASFTDQHLRSVHRHENIKEDAWNEIISIIDAPNKEIPHSTFVETVGDDERATHFLQQNIFAYHAKRDSVSLQSTPI